MFSVITRKGFELFIITGLEAAKRKAYRYFIRRGKAVKVIDLSTGLPVASFGV